MSEALSDKERLLVRAVQNVHQQLVTMLNGGTIVAIAGAVTVRHDDGSESTGRFNLGGDRRGQMQAHKTTLRLPNGR